jgi:hypothetical protein
MPVPPVIIEEFVKGNADHKLEPFPILNCFVSVA